MRDFADLARALRSATQEADRLMLAVEAAVELVPGCSCAGLTINRDGECRTLAATAEALTAANTLQNELGEGPCFPPGREEETVVSQDLVRDERWPVWGRRVHQDLGLGSMMSVLVFSGRHVYGTLSVYGTGPGTFTADGLATVQALAGHLAVSLAAGREIDGLGLALTSRTVIGQAEGIVMERLGVDADQALAYLKRISSHTNTKLVEVALRLVESRELPEG